MSKQPTAPQMRALLAAAANGGRLPLNCLAYTGVFAPYAGTHSPGLDLIRAVLAKAAKARSALRAEAILCDELDFDQLITAGGFLNIKRDSFRDGKGDLGERYAKALYSGHGRIEGVTSLNVRACIRAGWLDERWNLTTEGRDAAFAADPDAYADALPADQLDAELIRADKALIAAGRAELCTVAINPDYPHTYEHDADVAAADSTHPGYNTCGRSVMQHVDYTPERIRSANWRESCYQRAAENAVHAGIPMNLSIAGQQLRDEAHTDALAEHPDQPVMLVVDDAHTAVPDRSGKARAMIADLIRDSRDPRMIVRDGDPRRGQYPTIAAMLADIDPLPTFEKGEMVVQGTIGGTTGRGKTYPTVPVSDPAEVAAAMAGVQIATLDPGSRDELTAGILPSLAARLYAGTHPDLADELRPAAVHARDAVLTAIRAADPDAASSQALDGDPTAAGFRLRLHLTRTRHSAGYPETVRVALLHLELGLTAGANHSRGLALAGMRKTVAKLGAAPYTA